MRALLKKSKRFGGKSDRSKLTRNLGYKVDNLAKQVKRNAPEVKVWTNAVASTALTGNTEQFVLLNDIDQGDANGQRDGLYITNRKLKFGGYIKSGAGITATNVTRVIVFKWFDKTAPADGDILQQDLAGSTEADVNAPYNIIKRDRFKVLYDIVVRTSANGLDGDLRNFRYSKKLNGKVKYSGDQGTNIEKGQIYLCTFSTGNVTLGSFAWEYKYTD